MFAAAVALMFGASALHHRIVWRERGYRWSRRVDHAGIFLLIAGTYTPFAVLVLDGAWSITILAVVWSGALAAILLKFLWVDAPKWLAATLAIALGWVAVVVFPQLIEGVGWSGSSLVLAGGLLYTAGGVVYAMRQPEPSSGGLRLPRDLPRARGRRQSGSSTRWSRSGSSIRSRAFPPQISR